MRTYAALTKTIDKLKAKVESLKRENSLIKREINKEARKLQACLASAPVE